MPGDAAIGGHDAVGPHATWYCVRRDGRAGRSGWIAGTALAELPARVGATRGEVVEVSAVQGRRRVSVPAFDEVFRNRDRGVLGIELAWADVRERVAPTHMIASNLCFKRVLARFLKRHGVPGGEFANEGRAYALSARQFLLPVGGEPVELVRGSTTIPEVAPGDETAARELADGIARWMLDNLSADGALPYKYWPSRGEESPADNALRRFLATWSLARLGALRRDPELREASVRNLRYNIARYFRDIGGGRGAIVDRGGAKLGAAAVAGLAILDSPAREAFLPQLDMLAAAVDSMVDEHDGFRTFFFPRERDGDNWNFYSGEALLFWAEALRRQLSSAPPMERYLTVFRKCRERHYRARNPAFVPWHTQAAASMFARTGRREFAEFAFEMSDWLLPMQQWDGLEPDLRGRFHDPRRPEFGPPHAASTGAYLEGLADALWLARSVGDHRRAEIYERALRRGLRSLRQLQFRGDTDAWYVSRGRRVMGALRTETYDNAVRVDSAAHALGAVVQGLRPKALGDT